MSSRVLRDDVWTSESIDALHDKTFRLYVCVINAADDYGLVETGFGHLCRAAPLRRWSAEEVLKMLSEMYDGHILLPYRVHEKTYCAVDKWQCFMRSVKPRCPIPSFGLAHIRMPYGFKNERVRQAASLLLKHLDIKGTTPGLPQGISGDDLGHVGNKELGVRSREEGNKEKKKKTPTQKPGGGAFESFWAAYPHFPQRSSKAQSRKRWEAMNLDPIAADVMRALDTCLAIAAWTRDGRQFVGSSEAWLYKRLWEQEAQIATDSLLESIQNDPRCQ